MQSSTRRQEAHILRFFTRILPPFITRPHTIIVRSAGFKTIDTCAYRHRHRPVRHRAFLAFTHTRTRRHMPKRRRDTPHKRTRSSTTTFWVHTPPEFSTPRMRPLFQFQWRRPFTRHFRKNPISPKHFHSPAFPVTSITNIQAMRNRIDSKRFNALEAMRHRFFGFFNAFTRLLLASQSTEKPAGRTELEDNRPLATSYVNGFRHVDIAVITATIAATINRHVRESPDAVFVFQAQRSGRREATRRRVFTKTNGFKKIDDRARRSTIDYDDVAVKT